MIYDIVKVNQKIIYHHEFNSQLGAFLFGLDIFNLKNKGDEWKWMYYMNWICCMKDGY